MRKLKPSVKAALASTLVLTSTVAIAYAVPGMTNNKNTDIGNKLKLDVERVDSDTVKVSIDNVKDIPKSLQFSIKLEGVQLQDGEKSIKDLVEKEVTARLNNNAYANQDNGILTDYTYNESENTIDVLITSENSLPKKSGNKVEIFELDVKKTSKNKTGTYKVVPTKENEYKYVSNTNKEYNNLGVAHDNKDIAMAVAPTIASSEQYMSVVEGEVLTAEKLKTGLGIVLTDEEGTKDLELEILEKGKVITEFKKDTTGIYELELKAVNKNFDLKSEAMKIQVNVVLDKITEPPTITMNGNALADITIDGGSPFDPSKNVKAVDKKGRDVKVEVKADRALDLDPDTDTEYTLTYTATDIYGNKTEQNIKLKVSANQVPVISGVQDRSISVGDKFNPKDGVTVTDDKDSNIELKVEGEVNTKIPGKYKVSYSATDSGGKTARAQSTVTVNPKAGIINKVPVITASDKTIKEGEKFDPLKDVSAFDEEDKDLTKAIKVSKNEVNSSKVGTYKVVYEVTDSKGAKATKEITVKVVPKLSVINKVPVITADDRTITVGDEFDPLEGVTAYDEEDKSLTSKIKIVDNEVNTNRVGKYFVTYQVTDSGGAKATKTITVMVNPKPSVINSVPTIEAVDKVIKVGDKFNELEGVKAYDKEDLDLTHKIEVVENTVDTTKPGKYTVKYSVTDSAGATKTKTITVTVLMKLVDINHPPEIRAIDKVVKLGSTFDPKENIVAYDREDLDITHKLEVIENTVNTKEAGTYTVKYRVTDNGGATTTKVINVVVKSDVILADSITINGKSNNKVYVGGGKTITASVNEGADLKDIDWKISDPSIAELRIVRNEARIIAKAEGTVTLTALTTDGSNKSDTMTIDISNFDSDSEIPTYVKDIIDTNVITPMSGSGVKEYPLEFEVKDVTVDELDGFLSSLESLRYSVISVSEDDEFTNYRIRVAKKSGLFRLFKSAEDTYLNIKVSKNLDNADEINDRLVELADKGTEKPNKKPTISIEGLNTNITVGDKFDPLAGVIAFDDEDGDLTKSIKVSGKVDTTKAGKYTLTYTVADSQGEEAKITVDITVSEKTTTKPNKGTKPVIKVTSSIDTITVGDKFDPLAGVSAYDKEDGDLTAAIKVSGKVDTSKAGKYTLTYTVEDKDGNVSTFTRVIFVKEKEASKDKNNNVDTSKDENNKDKSKENNNSKDKSEDVNNKEEASEDNNDNKETSKDDNNKEETSKDEDNSKSETGYVKVLGVAGILSVVAGGLFIKRKKEEK